MELWGYAQEDAAALPKYIVDESIDARIVLREIRAEPVIVHAVTRSKGECGVVHREAPISTDTEFQGY